MCSRPVAATLLLLSLGIGGIGGCRGLAGYVTASQPLVDASLDLAAEFARPPWDSGRLEDGPLPDTLDGGSPDLDTGPVDLEHAEPALAPFHPLSVTQLVTAWTKLRVPCLDDNGDPAGADISILDSPKVTFHDGAVTVAPAAAASTKAWVNTGGNTTSVILVWNPNACGTEDPSIPDNEWSEAGLLIRKASLTVTGELALASDTTTADMNLLNVHTDGSFENEYALPDDSALDKQLVPTVTAAKQGILDAARY